jgi:hypothetical protein
MLIKTENKPVQRKIEDQKSFISIIMRLKKDKKKNKKINLSPNIRTTKVDTDTLLYMVGAHK